MHQHSLPPLITIVGPTASGKTRWGIEIARDISGEIISADSRQVYRYMNIGTAKEPGVWKYRFSLPPYRAYVCEGVSHHLIDYIDPEVRYTMAHFKRDATEKIQAIHSRQHVPLIVGGTGLYVQSVVDNYQIPEIPPDESLRNELETYSTEVLLEKLSQIYPSARHTIDVHNRRRIIRAIEVATYSADTILSQPEPMRYTTLQIGIHVDRDVLYKRINERIHAMIRNGLVDEIASLVQRGYDWDLPSMSSVGYRQFRPYIDGRASLESCIAVLQRDSRQYAKRQLTWFRRNPNIVWCSHLEEAKTHIQSFIS